MEGKLRFKNGGKVETLILKQTNETEEQQVGELIENLNSLKYDDKGNMVSHK